MAATAELQKELATFEAHRDDLLGSARGKYVLIHGDQIYGTFESEQDAVDEGYREFGHVPFLVKQILEVDVPLNFVSGRLAI